MAPFAPSHPEESKGRSLPKISAMEKAMRLLSMRALSETELRQRLRGNGYPLRETEDAVAECRRRKYLDDELLAADCAALCRERGLGTRAVLFRLRRRGISAPTAEEVLAGEAPDAELEAARRAAGAKLASLERESDPRKRRDKLLRFMASRGFRASTARRIMEELGTRAEDDIL